MKLLWDSLLVACRASEQEQQQGDTKADAGMECGESLGREPPLPVNASVVQVCGAHCLPAILLPVHRAAWPITLTLLPPTALPRTLRAVKRASFCRIRATGIPCSLVQRSVLDPPTPPCPTHAELQPEASTSSPLSMCTVNVQGGKGGRAIRITLLPPPSDRQDLLAVVDLGRSAEVGCIGRLA